MKAPPLDLEAIVQRPSLRPRGFAILEKDLTTAGWLCDELRRVGLEVVPVPPVRMESTIANIGVLSPVVVVIQQSGIGGIAGQIDLDSRAQRLRRANSTVGLVIVRDTPCVLMPPRCIRMQSARDRSFLEALVSSLDAHLADVFDIARSRAALPHPTRAASKRKDPERLVPNINIKHPGMLIGVARVARKLKTPIFCEISAYEALVYYCSGGRSVAQPVDTVRDALQRFRSDADRVIEAVGGDLRVHLDHAHDLDLIYRALDLGFDSVMADGSNRTLEANIRFVKNVTNRAASYSIPVEAEVGDLDASGPRRFNHTDVRDVRHFLQEVEPDYLAVCVGQDHSSDYGFERARRNLAQVGDLDQQHIHSGRRCLYQASLEKDAELEELGLDVDCSARKQLHGLQRRLVDGHLPLEEILSEAETAACITDERVLVSVRVRAAELRLEVERTRARLYSEAIGVGHKDSPYSLNRRSLNQELLSEICGELRQTRTRLVLHGGSSISKGDFSLLPKRVRRVNFGSSAYLGYANAVLSRRVRSGHLEELTRLDMAAMLQTEAADWEKWLDHPPEFLQGFESFLQREFFVPLGLKCTDRTSAA